MALPEVRLLEAAITLTEELNFSVAAQRLRIDQSTLSKRIQDLESQLGFLLFDRNPQSVDLTEAGRKFVEGAREAVLNIERAISSAKAAHRGADDVLSLGNTPGTDPYLVSTLLTVRLPLFPKMKIRTSSNYSHEVAREVIAGTLDVALTTAIPDNAKLSCLKLAEKPLYIAMPALDPLSFLRQIELHNLRDRNWVLPSRHICPYLYDVIQRQAAAGSVTPTEIHHASTPEEAALLILRDSAVAFLSESGAWRIAQSGITMRPLADESIKLVTSLAVRSDSKSRLVSEFVRATARKLDGLRRPMQQSLSLDV